MTDRSSEAGAVTVGFLGEGGELAPFVAAREDARYLEGKLLGIGGMGEVRSFVDRATGRSIAMKTVRTAGDAIALRRFAREARIQSQLEHPSIVPVYDVGIDPAGAPYITMKHVRGDSLASVITRLRAGDEATEQRFTRRKLLTVLSSVAMTVEYAHRRGVIHRDLKPDNIMLGPFDEVYVLDWGLAAIVAEASPSGAGDPLSATPGSSLSARSSGLSSDAPLRDASAAGRLATASPVVRVSAQIAAVPDPDDRASQPLVDSSPRPETATGSLLGTPGYLAPELLDHHEAGAGPAATAQSDVYALGAILYELLVYEPMNRGDSIAAKLGMALDLDGPSPRARAAELARAEALRPADRARRAAEARDAPAVSGAAPTVADLPRGAALERADAQRARAVVGAVVEDVPPELDALAQLATRRDPAARLDTAAAFARAIERFLDGDRDTAQRKELAARAVATAAAVAASPDITLEARSKAMHDVTVALGLDPDNAAARALLVRLLAQPPREAAKLAEEVGREARMRSFQFAARTFIYAQLSYVLYVPLLLWMGIRNWWMMLFGTTMILGVLAVTVHYIRRPPRDLQVPLPHLLISLAALLSGEVLFGPLVLVPSIVVATGVGYLVNFESGRGRIIAGCLAVVFVPVALQLAGVLPASYEFTDGRISIVPMMTDLPVTPTMILLIASHAITLTVAMLFVAHLRRSYVEAERALRLQAWHLGQLVPEEARPAQPYARSSHGD